MKRAMEPAEERPNQRRVAHRPPPTEPAVPVPAQREVAAALARSSPPMSVRTVALLQRQAGNRATGRLLAQRRKATAQPPAPGHQGTAVPAHRSTADPATTAGVNDGDAVQRLVAGPGDPGQDAKFAAFKGNGWAKQRRYGNAAVVSLLARNDPTVQRGNNPGGGHTIEQDEDDLATQDVQKLPLENIRDIFRRKIDDYSRMTQLRLGARKDGLELLEKGFSWVKSELGARAVFRWFSNRAKLFSPEELQPVLRLHLTWVDAKSKDSFPPRRDPLEPDELKELEEMIRGRISEPKEDERSADCEYRAQAICEAIIEKYPHYHPLLSKMWASGNLIKSWNHHVAPCLRTVNGQYVIDFATIGVVSTSVWHKHISTPASNMATLQESPWEPLGRPEPAPDLAWLAEGEDEQTLAFKGELDPGSLLSISAEHRESIDKWKSASSST